MLNESLMKRKWKLLITFASKF